VDIILVPGLWLDGSSWADVTPTLEKAGHRAHPLTLPGMESRATDRSRIRLRDHVDATVAAIDAIDPNAGKVVLVGHSAGAGIAYAAIDARPDRVARAVFVGGFPVGDGNALADGFPVANGEAPLPEWSAFEDEDLADLDDAGRARFRERAIPSPEHVMRDPQRLSGDERRLDVPVTVISTEFSSDALRGWIAKEMPPVQEFTKLHDVTYVDLPTGHWPQFTRPEDLARAILDAIAKPPAKAIDPHGRIEPPYAGDETATLLGFLDFQRATLAWKCAGLDADGLRAKVGASSMTLGGMLKHMAYVEDLWFSRRLHGRDPHPPWDNVDWGADQDWDWHSADGDAPEQLHALWQDAVARSRALLAEALATGGPARRAVWIDDWFGEAPTLRWILIHMIREYARHDGHADLLRESIDGETGE
jgi:pimeloyl-ACP methyl ester carboxylesterase/uncharacterized damage-inducible protein DinB